MTVPKTMHFISGLPRAGSTLLSALLRQNPRFHADIISPMGALFRANLGVMSAGSEFASRLPQQQRAAILKGLFDSYYGTLTDREVVFDSSRLWCARLPAVHEMFPQSKVICCVRDVHWILDSLERLLRKQPFENTLLFNDNSERSNIYTRTEALTQRDRLVGFAWSALKEAFYGERSQSLLLVEYDLLAQAPDKVMRLVYDFIGEEWFDHDFDNVQFDAQEFDAPLGISGMHTVRPKVAFEPRTSILPPDVIEQYAQLSFWRDPAGSAASIITAQPSDTPNHATPLSVVEK